MYNQENLIMTEHDFQTLSSLIKTANAEIADLLEEELSRASVVPGNTLPKDVVAMNSKVRFQDLNTGAESDITLVYPHEANIEENKISILAPIGSALIGLRVGQVIQWPLQNGKERTLKVISVLSQPVSA